MLCNGEKTLLGCEEESLGLEMQRKGHQDSREKTVGLYHFLLATAVSSEKKGEGHSQNYAQEWLRGLRSHSALAKSARSLQVHQVESHVNMSGR